MPPAHAPLKVQLLSLLMLHGFDGASMGSMEQGYYHNTTCVWKDVHVQGNTPEASNKHESIHLSGVGLLCMHTYVQHAMPTYAALGWCGRRDMVTTLLLEGPDAIHLLARDDSRFVAVQA